MSEQNILAVELFNKNVPGDTDYQKMLGYIQKGSNPERVAKSIKDINKFIRRYKVALQFGNYDYIEPFKNVLFRDTIYSINQRFKLNERCEFYNTLNALFKDYNESLPEQYGNIVEQHTIEVPGVEQLTSQRALLFAAPSLYKYLIKTNRPFSLKLRPVTDHEAEFFKDNGRIWPMAYSLWINDRNGLIKKFDFCYYSSEGDKRTNYYTTPEHNRGDWVINQHELLETLQRIIQ